MRIRSWLFLLAGIVIGLLIGMQIRGAVADSTPCAFPTVTAIASPAKVASPTASKPTNVLLVVGGTGGKQSALFHAHGPFTLHWTTRYLDQSNPFMIFSVAIDNANGAQQDAISSESPGSDSSVEHVDCTKGCYLSIDSAGISYKLIVTK